MTGRAPFSGFTNSLEESEEPQRMKGRPPSFTLARVTNNQDPNGLRRIKVSYPWSRGPNDEILQSSWIQQLVATGNAGPTLPGRRSPWGSDPPLPEVGTQVGILFNQDDEDDPVWIGMTRYGDGSTYQVPGTTKQDPLDWCAKESYPNGTQWGIDPEGTTQIQIPGHAVIKIGGNLTIECRGQVKIVSQYLGLVAMVVTRVVAAKLDMSDKFRPDEIQALTQMVIDTMTPMGPVTPYTPIGQVQDIDDTGGGL
ncbi:MAG TPA: phage baseplate assembly protein V [Blastocatellia bacterium]